MNCFSNEILLTNELQNCLFAYNTQFCLKILSIIESNVKNVLILTEKLFRFTSYRSESQSKPNGNPMETYRKLSIVLRQSLSQVHTTRQQFPFMALSMINLELTSYLLLCLLLYSTNSKETQDSLPFELNA